MAIPPTDPSLPLQAGFVVISLLLVASFAYVSRSKRAALVGAAWLALTGILAGMGFLADFSALPPRVVLVFAPAGLAAIILAFTRFGARFAALPLSVLIGFQAFRILVELLIHQAVREGIAPPQLTWGGWNYDIVLAISALFLFPIAFRLPRWAILTWNTAGILFLAWVVAIAVLSMPTAFQKLSPDNTWVAFFPFVWLPSVIVVSALFGHLAIYRKLIRADSL
jgi:hypothetical protein